MNVVNLAHGDFVMLAMYVAFFAFTALHLGPALFAPLAAAALFALGVLVYLALVRHVMRGPMLGRRLALTLRTPRAALLGCVFGISAAMAADRQAVQGVPPGRSGLAGAGSRRRRTVGRLAGIRPSPPASRASRPRRAGAAAAP